jgi:hypothetical protein
MIDMCDTSVCQWYLWAVTEQRSFRTKFGHIQVYLKLTALNDKCSQFLQFCSRRLQTPTEIIFTSLESAFIQLAESLRTSPMDAPIVSEIYILQISPTFDYTRLQPLSGNILITIPWQYGLARKIELLSHFSGPCTFNKVSFKPVYRDLSPKTSV